MKYNALLGSLPVASMHSYYSNMNELKVSGWDVLLWFTFSLYAFRNVTIRNLKPILKSGNSVYTVNYNTH